MLRAWKRRRDRLCCRLGGGGGGCRSSSARLLVGERLERGEAVARRMPEEPPVIRMVLFLREVRAEG